MAGDGPAVEVDAPAAEAPAESLMDDVTQAAPSSEAKADETPAAESKPEGEKPTGDDAKAEGDKPEASLLDDESKPDEKADGKTDAKPAGAPEDYEPFTLPDGRELDGEALAKAAPLFKKHNLDQSSAQELVSLYDELMQAQGVAQVNAHVSEYNKWTKATRDDPEFGGEKLNESRGLMKRAITQFGGDAEAQKQLMTILDSPAKGGWGLGNHPLVFGLLVRAARATSPDQTVHSDVSAPANSKGQPWERMYPSMQAKDS